MNRVDNSKNLHIGNRQLAVIMAVILVGCALMVHRFMAPRQDSTVWAKLQSEVLGQDLSGQVLGALTDKPHLPEKIQVPILMYHHVGPLPKEAMEDKLRQDLTVSPEDFEVQVAWLKGQGFNSITLNDFYLYTEGKFELPKNPLIFTFDDGYRDVFQYAVPILKKYGYVGSFAVITQFDGISYGTNHYATWDEIRKAKKEGMEIVSHTQDHFDGTGKYASPTMIKRNLEGSQKDIEEHLGIKAVPAIVYPYGHYNEQYLEIAGTAGFKVGLTTRQGKVIDMSKLLEIPRLRVHGSHDIEKFKEMMLSNEVGSR